MLVNRSLTEDEVSFREEGARTTLMRNEPKVENCFFLIFEEKSSS